MYYVKKVAYGEEQTENYHLAAATLRSQHGCMYVCMSNYLVQYNVVSVHFCKPRKCGNFGFLCWLGLGKDVILTLTTAFVNTITGGHFLEVSLKLSSGVTVINGKTLLLLVKNIQRFQNNK